MAKTISHGNVHTNSQKALVSLLQWRESGASMILNKKDFADHAVSAIETLAAADLAELFITSAFLGSASQSLIDQHWLQTEKTANHEQSGFNSFLELALGSELSPLRFMSEFFQSPSAEDLARIGAQAYLIASAAADRAMSLANQAETRDNFHAFARSALQQMLGVNRVDSGFLSNALYRAYDELDRVLGLDYELDRGMHTDLTIGERLYEGAGVGVQTSYSSLLTALDGIKPSQGARFIDLGSGYGRVGLVVGLLRPDLEFIGYEYVPHRVENANMAARRAGLDERVRFITQDLADRDFQIPEAEVYYMYDPFSQDTYRYVFAQLKELGQRRAITVATKGRANEWFKQAVAGGTWSEDPSYDEGTLSLFRSNP